MASCKDACVPSKPECCDDEFARFEVDTEADYSDSESDDEEFSFGHQATDRTDASVEVHCGDLSDVEEETNIKIHIDEDAPLLLAVDMDDCVQVLQTMKLVCPGALAPSSMGLDVEDRLVPKRVFPKRPPGVFLPPGVFVRPPPGLPAPDCAVTSPPGL
eukprot:TRINITY_DN29263_c0_g1_i1.p1 TRINITY_DN29263_c0_g1~~TRINITY_DN29263_c0_g1_i1.p1  ORF type:complete len:186 (+),score=23.17 TRINITY_DN29263_c0_g1_i1:83-559(+)